VACGRIPWIRNREVFSAELGKNSRDHGTMRRARWEGMHIKRTAGRSAQRRAGDGKRSEATLAFARYTSEGHHPGSSEPGWCLFRLTFDDEGQPALLLLRLEPEQGDHLERCLKRPGVAEGGLVQQLGHRRFDLGDLPALAVFCDGDLLIQYPPQQRQVVRRSFRASPGGSGIRLSGNGYAAAVCNNRPRKAGQ
jgi:hypothetical protein